LASKIAQDKKAAESAHQEALKKQKQAFDDAKEAERLAQEADTKARIAEEAAAIAEHKSIIATQRSAFELEFRNVWKTGPTGLSIVQFTAKSVEQAENIISKAFTKTLAADVLEYKQPLRRATPKHQNQENDQHKVVMITGDDRVAELIEEIGIGMTDPNYNVLVTTLATSSKEYSEWVKLQTQKKDASTAFFNISPEAAIKALKNATFKENEQNL
jgi:uncharacterized protein involved in tolerance to divalent cations